MRFRILSLLAMTVIFMYSCQKSGVESPSSSLTRPTTAKSDSIAAKMLSYGFKPYAGPIDSNIRNLPDLTFEEFEQKMASWKTLTSRKTITSTQDATPGQAYFDDCMSSFTNVNGENFFVQYNFPNFQLLGLPSQFTVMGLTSGTIYNTSFIGPSNWSYFYQDATFIQGVGIGFIISAHEQALLLVTGQLYLQAYNLTLTGSQTGASIQLIPFN